MPHPELIELEVILTKKDFERVLLAKRRESFGLIWIITPIILVTSFFLFRNFSLTSLALFLLALPILAALEVVFTVKWQAVKLAKQSENTEVNISIYGIEINSIYQTSKTDWKAIYQVEELKKDFLIYFSKDSFFPIPKRYFQDDVQINSFRALANFGLGERAKLKS